MLVQGRDWNRALKLHLEICRSYFQFLQKLFGVGDETDEWESEEHGQQKPPVLGERVTGCGPSGTGSVQSSGASW